MSRDDGFRTADVDIGLLDDPKLRKLARACAGDEALLARSAIAYVAAVLGSWGDGERIPVDEAAPIWLTDVDRLRELLETAGLVDVDGCVPAHAWESWFGPAVARRTERREAGRRGGRAKAKNRAEASSAVAEPEVSSSQALPVPLRTVPSSPTGPSLPGAIARPPARGRGRLEPIGSILPTLARSRGEA